MEGFAPGAVALLVYVSQAPGRRNRTAEWRRAVTGLVPAPFQDSVRGGLVQSASYRGGRQVSCESHFPCPCSREIVL